MHIIFVSVAKKSSTVFVLLQGEVQLLLDSVTHTSEAIFRLVSGYNACAFLHFPQPNFCFLRAVYPL